MYGPAAMSHKLKKSFWVQWTLDSVLSQFSPRDLRVFCNYTWINLHCVSLSSISQFTFSRGQGRIWRQRTREKCKAGHSALLGEGSLSRGYMYKTRACLLPLPCDGPALSFKTVKVCVDLKQKEIWDMLILSLIPFGYGMHIIHLRKRAYFLM